MAQVTLLVGELKRYLKAHGVTYAALGQKLALSESTIKRLFAQQSFTLERFEQICHRRVFNRLSNRAGLREVRIHDIHYTYTSLLLSMGEPEACVKEQLGHSSIEITVDTYGHLAPSSNRVAVNKLGDLHQPKKNAVTL